MNAEKNTWEREWTDSIDIAPIYVIIDHFGYLSVPQSLLELSTTGDYYTTPNKIVRDFPDLIFRNIFTKSQNIY